MTGEIYRIAPADLASLLPELLLSGGGVLVLTLDAFLPGLKRLVNPLSLLAVVLAAFASWSWIPFGASFGGLLVATPFTSVLTLIVLLSAALCLLGSPGYLRREALPVGEYHALLLWCATGMVLMLRSTELITLFVALELLSICLYALAGFHRRLSVATEAAIKYFLMGAFVSAFALFGIALVYGATGTTTLAGIAAALQSGGGDGLLAPVGLLMLLAAFAFKMSLAPFHAWAPDAYQGAPSPFVAFLSVAPKVASALVLLRILQLAGEGRWPQVVALLAILSMVVGNLLALVQRDIKRMLAYSGIAHMGYLLIPLVALSSGTGEALAVYLLAYALMNGGAFVVVALLYGRAGEQHLIGDLAGWGYRFPLLGASLALCMLSLGGIPPTLGFLGKYLIFVHALEQGQLALALILVATSLVGIFYYLRVVYTLYMRPEVREPSGLALDLRGRLACLLAAAGSLVLGMLPQRLLAWLGAAAQSIATPGSVWPV